MPSANGANGTTCGVRLSGDEPTLKRQPVRPLVHVAFFEYVIPRYLLFFGRKLRQLRLGRGDDWPAVVDTVPADGGQDQVPTDLRVATGVS